MRKETIFLLAFIGFTTLSALGVWFFALPNFQPVSFPQIVSGQIETGPIRHRRDLTDAEVRVLNQWINGHKDGWGPLAHTPPSSGDARLFLKGQMNGKSDDIVLTLWTGISAADWNDTVFVEKPDGSYVRVHSFEKDAFMPLRRIAESFPFHRTSFP